MRKYQHMYARARTRECMNFRAYSLLIFFATATNRSSLRVWSSDLSSNNIRLCGEHQKVRIREQIIYNPFYNLLLLAFQYAVVSSKVFKLCLLQLAYNVVYISRSAYIHGVNGTYMGEVNGLRCDGVYKMFIKSSQCWSSIRSTYLGNRSYAKLISSRSYSSAMVYIWYIYMCTKYVRIWLITRVGV